MTHDALFSVYRPRVGVGSGTVAAQVGGDAVRAAATFESPLVETAAYISDSGRQRSEILEHVQANARYRSFRASLFEFVDGCELFSCLRKKRLTLQEKLARTLARKKGPVTYHVVHARTEDWPSRRCGRRTGVTRSRCTRRRLSCRCRTVFVCPTHGSSSSSIGCRVLPWSSCQRDSRAASTRHARTSARQN